MGGYSGCKISGHSGTDFKHKKGFAIRKENLKRCQRLGVKNTFNSSKYQLQKQPIYRTSELFKTTVSEYLLRIITTLLIVCLLGAVVVFAKKHGHHYSLDYYSTYQSKAVATQQMRFKNNDHRRAFNLAIYYGQAYLESGYLAEAQIEIVRALKILPKSSTANFLMTKVLVHRCLTEEQVCTEAEEYLNALSIFEDIDKTEVEKLGVLFKNNAPNLSDSI